MDGSLWKLPGATCIYLTMSTQRKSDRRRSAWQSTAPSWRPQVLLNSTHPCCVLLPKYGSRDLSRLWGAQLATDLYGVPLVVGWLQALDDPECWPPCTKTNDAATWSAGTCWKPRACVAVLPWKELMLPNTRCPACDRLLPWLVPFLCVL